MSVNENNRVCGDCQACCYAPRLDEMKKPSFTRCRNQGEGECTDYDNRPDLCRKFECLWLQGHWEENDRPDKSGMMLTCRDHEKYGPWVSLHVVSDEALQSKSNKEILIDLVKKTVVIEMQPRSMRMIGGPKERADKFMALSEDEQVPLHRNIVSLIPIKLLVRNRSK